MKGSKKPKTGRLISSTTGLDYAFLDSGNFRKLERFGPYVLNRPEITAKWKPNLSKKNWEAAHWYFFEEKGKKGHWKSTNKAPESWEVIYDTGEKKIRLFVELTAFKHIGLFPEQAANWSYIYKHIQEIIKTQPEVKVLNLFAYTGAASLVASNAGAQVTHVDSVKQVLQWAKRNGESNQIDSIRWILEDARRFVDKSIRRGDRFHGIILDPPAFGLGAKKEVWKLENDLQALLENCMKVLNPKSHFFILNTYSPKLSRDDLKLLLQKTARFPKHYESAHLGLCSESKQDLPLGNLVRFST